ncbi:LuxR family transcriptional regulator [Rhodovulum sp. ES.010]|uniref:LuxR family transcriptional regulator n=1 Tax=Rhodovulum sp. ES.010 TaxID=1882821 RepID=UPI0009287A17|nr:LuxR family transcriptional regulator [Rhodovulum sp. ES.010]SIO20008.1 LuxR family transcriptional regulator [Rhodovulum sp. ES.010]
MTLDYVRALVNVRSVEELWALHSRKMADFGFDRIIYGFTRFRTARSFGDREDFVVLSNLCAEYMQAFVERGLYREAPMVRWATDNEGVCSWSELERRRARGELTEEEAKAVEFNRSMGMTAGYTIAFRDISVRAKGAIGLVARPGLDQEAVDSVWAEHGRDLLLMNELMHLKVQNLPYASTRPPLTPRQREVLEWVGDGKTTQDIATILGVTPATVEKHLRLARETLDVETTAQAVLKAWFQNQIFSAPP